MNIHYYDKTKTTLVFVRRDVTDNYEEEQNRQREIYDAMLAAKRADRSKSEFLERMSHEIRTPLNSIIGLSYLSRANLGDEKKVLENFDKIEMSAQFLRSCMDDILNLSLLESGRVAFHEESTDFEAFLTHIEKEFSDKAQEKKISFSVQRRGSFADQYLFDREKLNEALSAILENAVKYTQPEGSVFFIIELFTRGEQETIFRFEIRDNGIGMEQNFLPHIFDAFAQEDDRNTTLSGGTGLGLTISKNIIDFMGGKIDVYSEKGKGSAFVVTVPLKTAKEDRRRTERTTYQEYDFSGKRVLLVEDNEINIEITRNIAERFNGIYGNVFKIPDGFIPKNGARVMSLQDPTRKMSKSDENVNGCVHLLDAPEVIMKKFKRAVTDSEAKVRYAEGKDGVNNLMAIYSAVTGLSYEQIEKDFDGKGYGDFKTAVGEAVVEELRPIRERYEKLVADKAYLESCYRKADEIALKISSRTMGKVMKKIGFI